MLRYFVVAVCLLVIVVLFARHLVTASFLADGSGEAIYENIYINGIAVGGLTRPEAEAILQKAEELDRRVIGFTYQDSLIYSFT